MSSEGTLIVNDKGYLDIVAAARQWDALVQRERTTLLDLATSGSFSGGSSSSSSASSKSGGGVAGWIASLWGSSSNERKQPPSPQPSPPTSLSTLVPSPSSSSSGNFWLPTHAPVSNAWCQGVETRSLFQVERDRRYAALHAAASALGDCLQEEQEALDSIVADILTNPHFGSASMMATSPPRGTTTTNSKVGGDYNEVEVEGGARRRGGTEGAGGIQVDLSIVFGENAEEEMVNGEIQLRTFATEAAALLDSLGDQRKGAISIVQGLAGQLARCKEEARRSGVFCARHLHSLEELKQQWTLVATAANGNGGSIGGGQAAPSSSGRVDVLTGVPLNQQIAARLLSNDILRLRSSVDRSAVVGLTEAAASTRRHVHASVVMCSSGLASLWAAPRSALWRNFDEVDRAQRHGAAEIAAQHVHPGSLAKVPSEVVPLPIDE